MLRWLLIGFVGLVGCAKSATPEAAAPAADAAAPAMSEAETAIRGAFQSYRQGLLDSDGSTSASVVDERTLAWFEELVGKAVDLDRAGFEQLGLLDALMVLKMRQEMSKGELQAIQGDAYAKLASNSAFVDPSVAQMVTKLERVTVSGETAAATVPMAPEQDVFFFVRENDVWKIDNWKIMEAAGLFDNGTDLDLTTDEGKNTLKTSMDMAATMSGNEGMSQETFDALIEGPRE